MTIEELEKIKFHFVCHMSMENLHTCTYASEDNHFGFCDRTSYKNGRPCRTTRHYRIGSDIYKSYKKFIEAVKRI